MARPTAGTRTTSRRGAYPNRRTPVWPQSTCGRLQGCLLRLRFSQRALTLTEVLAAGPAVSAP